MMIPLRFWNPSVTIVVSTPLAEVKCFGFDSTLMIVKRFEDTVAIIKAAMTNHAHFQRLQQKRFSAKRTHTSHHVQKQHLLVGL